MSTITTSTPLTGTSTGTLNEAMRYATMRGAERPEFVADYLSVLFELAPQVGLRADLAVAQSVHETNAWRSGWWTGRGNPAGIAITGDPAQDAASGTWATGRDAAKAQLVHLLGYVRGSAPAVAEPWIKLDPRWDALMQSGMAGTAQTVGDFGGGVWAVDPGYADKWISRFADVFNRFSVPVEQPPAGGPAMSGIPIVKNILPWSASNRPGSKLPGGGRLYIVVHETGNAGVGADADNQIAYLQTAEARSRSVSYHLSVDDHQIVQGLPLDEIGYHAGDGCDEPDKDIGCFRSVGIEACINADGDEMQMRRNLAECIARICAGDPGFDWGGGSTKGRFDIDHLLQHYQVNEDSGADRHYCPQHILQQGFWPTLMLWVDQAWLVWGTTSTPVPAGPTYAKPGPIPVKRDGNDHAVGKGTFYAVERVVRADAGAHFLNVADPKGKDTRAVARANEAFRVAWAVKGTGAVWYWVTPHGSRIAMHDTDTELVVKRAA